MKLIKVALAVLIMALGIAFFYEGPQVQMEASAASGFDTKLGDPIPGITEKELGKFNIGKTEFEREHVPEDGLGPTFNQISCVACHSVPVTGGSLPTKRDLVVRIGRPDPVTGKYDPLTEFGGQVLSRQSVTTRGLLQDCRQPGNNIPAEAEFVSFRFGQPLFGMGLIDNIAEETILANADPDDRDRNGISGRPNMVISNSSKEIRIGRLGWKAQMVSLSDFCADSYLVEIGITSPDFPNERKPNGKDPKCDLVPDSPEPEDRIGFSVQGFVDFLTFLAPAPVKTLDASAQNGKALFNSIGCAKCHIPTMMTASNPLAGPSLANREANLYSDLLLHDMGEDLADGIEQPDKEFQPSGTKPASGREWRTQPLWGLSAKTFFLHDARTTDITTAIILHGGEAASSRNKFLKLKNKARTDLLNFLKSL